MGAQQHLGFCCLPQIHPFSHSHGAANRIEPTRSPAQCLEECRGTASMQNVLTDAKAWKMPLLPVRRRAGQVVKVRRGGWGVDRV